MYTEETIDKLDSFLKNYLDKNSDVRRFKDEEEKCYILISQNNPELLEVLGGYLMSISEQGKEFIKLGGFRAKFDYIKNDRKLEKKRLEQRDELVTLQIKNLKNEIAEMWKKVEFWQTTSQTNKEKQDSMWIAIGISLLGLFILIGEKLVLLISQ